MIVMFITICAVALAVSALTLVSGFGLGTLLMPTFAIFFPLSAAIAATATVHLANNIVKIMLVGKHAHAATVLRFLLGAVPAAAIGAGLLTLLGNTTPLVTYSLGSYVCEVTFTKITIGAVLVLFALIEFLPRFDNWAFAPKWLPLGGAISGFFGGLAGMQGALRSAFLIRCGLTKEQFVGTGAVVSTVIDCLRLCIYGVSYIMFASGEHGQGTLGLQSKVLGYLIPAACISAFIGSYLGSRLITKVTIRTIKVIVASGLVFCGVLLIMGPIRA